MNVPIITYLPADKTALTPGAHIIMVAVTKAADGSLTTTSVGVGKDDLYPADVSHRARFVVPARRRRTARTEARLGYVRRTTSCHR